MATKKAYIKQVKGITFLGKSDSNHWVTMDGSPEFGGSSAGTGPKELLLLGLGGCTGSDVVSMLKKKRINLQDFEMNISAEVSEEHPKVFTKVHLEYVFYGENIPEKDVEHVIELSRTKYCGVGAMLEKAFPITHSYRIVEKKAAESPVL